MNANSFRILEFERIRALLLQGVGSAQGRERVESLAPLRRVGEVREALERTSQAVALLSEAGRQPYHDLPDPREALAIARVEGAHLEARALTDLASFVEGGLEVARRVARAERAPLLARLASRVEDSGAIAAAIRRAILPSGEVADDASPRLAELRRTLARLRSELTSVMDGYLRSVLTERLLQDRIITTRNDRYVLLLKAEHKGQLPGIVHGSSGSGASLFVEPLPAVELNNDIVELQDAERREVLRVLGELTARAGERAPQMEAMADVLGELDALQAMALLSLAMDARAPEIVDADPGGSAAARRSTPLLLNEARHPLLMPQLAERLGIARSGPPVPVTIGVGGEEPVLVISGPNTGGKTVALKTVGLFALMAQSGLHVPAAEGSRLPVFQSVFADIGDEQSIAESLSTFSAHLATIVEMTRGLERPALVLLDEVGGGTDPTEGGALGVAIVEHFRKAGATVIATTHHGLMKAYAQSTPGVASASFGYDKASYRPTYELTLGSPGRSLALEMAERLGLPAEVVADARSRRDEKERQAEALIAKLEAQAAELQQERGRIEALRGEAEAAHARAALAEREIQARKRREVELFARELKRRAEENERRAAEAIRAAVERLEQARRAETAAPRVRGEAVAAMREAAAELLRDPELGLPEEREAPDAALAVGTRVRVRSLGVAGEVLALHERDAELAVAGKRLRVPTSDLVALGSAATSREPRGRTGREPVAPTKSVPSELNLIGLTVEDAEQRVDKMLDDAALSDRHELRIVHGFGEGKLRKAVARLLDKHPLVASWRPGGPGEGGGGATVVELKD